MNALREYAGSAGAGRSSTADVVTASIVGRCTEAHRGLMVFPQLSVSSAASSLL